MATWPARHQSCAVGSPTSCRSTSTSLRLRHHQAVADGGDLEAPQTADAVAALDANSVALSEAVGSVYGDEAGKQFLELWRAHIGFFVDYTLGGATGDMKAQDAAKAKLDAYRADFGAFIDSATGGELPADAVAVDLQVHVNSLIEAIDAAIAADPSFFPKMRTAAQHMPMTALALASAISVQMPDQFRKLIDVRDRTFPPAGHGRPCRRRPRDGGGLRRR